MFENDLVDTWCIVKLCNINVFDVDQKMNYLENEYHPHWDES